MAKIAWRNLVDDATFLSASEWEAERPLTELQKPRLQGLARSTGGSPNIDLDFGVPVTFDLIAMLGMAPLVDSTIVYMLGSNVSIGGSEAFSAGTIYLGTDGSKVAPNLFHFDTPATCQYLRIFFDYSGTPITPAAIDLRRLWVGPTLDVDVGDDFGIGVADPSEVTVSDEQAAFVGSKRKARYLDFSCETTAEKAFSFVSPSLLCLAEMDLQIGDSEEVIVAPRLTSPGADFRRVILMTALYGLLRNRSSLTKSGDDLFTYRARVQELPSNFS